MQSRLLAVYILALIGLMQSVSTTLAADPLTIAVASNFREPMQRLQELFKTEHPQIVSRVVYASSGKLYTQIRHGAPYDILLSADQKGPAMLEKDDLIVPGSRYVYAEGRLALWSVATDKESDLKNRLHSNNFNKLAIAHPDIAPYGRASIEVLTQLGLIDKVKTKLVRGESIAHAYQFAHSGNADLAFVALSQMHSGDDYWLVPSELHSPIVQEAVHLKRAESKIAATTFIMFLKSKTAIHIIKSYGYTVSPDFSQNADKKD